MHFGPANQIFVCPLSSPVEPHKIHKIEYFYFLVINIMLVRKTPDNGLTTKQTITLKSLLTRVLQSR